MAILLNENTVVLSTEEYSKLKLYSFKYTQLLANLVVDWEGYEDSLAQIDNASYRQQVIDDLEKVSLD